MKAFGQIIKSMFILQYIDQVELRQAIEKQLNKIEPANGFTRTVAVGNPNRLEYAEKSDQEITEGCNRLIKNGIKCRNYHYLAQKITLVKSEEERKRLLEIIEKAYSFYSDRSVFLQNAVAMQAVTTRC